MQGKKIFCLVACLLLTIFSILPAGCAQQEAEEEEKITVAVSILPEQAFVKAVCGDLADIVLMVPSGSSPANYEATPAQMEALRASDVYFSIGVPAEEAILSDLEGEVEVVALAEKVDAAYAPRTFSSGTRDPHIWLSPKRAIVMVQAIADTLAGIDPNHAEIYQKNAAAYIEEIEAADAEIKELFSGISNNIFIVTHPAFGYFADEYGLEMYALEENGKEATAQHLQDLIDLAKEKGIKTIFTQAETASEQPDTFAEEVGGTKVVLNPLSEEYVQNLKDIANALAQSME